MPQGRRVYPLSDDVWPSLESGDYCFVPNKRMLRFKTPSGVYGWIHGREGGWQITEHEDGTVSVHPSIKIMEGEREVWHGYLTKGQWSIP